MSHLMALTGPEARAAALERLQRIDPHGTYTDAASAAEGREPAELWEALASLAAALEGVEHAEEHAAALRLLAVAVMRQQAQQEVTA